MKRLFALLTVVTLSVGLTACAPRADLTADGAAVLQDGVAVVTEAASAGDFTAALTALDALAAQVASAADEELVSPERARAIEDSMAVIRADLEASIAVKAEADRIAAEKAEADRIAAEVAAEQQRLADEEAQRQLEQLNEQQNQESDKDPGKEKDENKGKNEGKGKGKD